MWVTVTGLCSTYISQEVTSITYVTSRHAEISNLKFEKWHSKLPQENPHLNYYFYPFSFHSGSSETQLHKHRFRPPMRYRRRIPKRVTDSPISGTKFAFPLPFPSPLSAYIRWTQIGSWLFKFWIYKKEVPGLDLVGIYLFVLKELGGHGMRGGVFETGVVDFFIVLFYIDHRCLCFWGFCFV